MPITEGGPSHGAVALFQLTFAIITPALVSGAVVERLNFKAWMLFILLWSTFIYLPLAHMVWGPGGFLGVSGGIGALDFAGGYVVEIASGVAALVAAIVVGPRRAYPQQVAPPHNVSFILFGAGLLGVLLTGIFAMKTLNPAGANGLLAGNPIQFWIQLKAAGFTILWVAIGTYVVLILIRQFVPLRVGDQQERQGLDVSSHGEEAYNNEFTG